MGRRRFRDFRALARSARLWQHAFMISWRDDATQEEQDELDDLLNVTLPLAGEMLQRHSEFFPFGASISIDGETQF